MKKREEVKATYTGGDMRMEGGSPYCHLALGSASQTVFHSALRFESTAFGQAELVPVALVQASSFSFSSFSIYL